MSDYEPRTYGDRWAEVYDAWTEARFGSDDVESTVDQLTSLCPGRRVLELGIGTGRVALPLAQRGLEVHGIDASEAMVAKLRDKRGGDAIPVTIGDFADVDVEGEFDLVFVVFNTFFALLSQDDQVRCFRNVAAHLGPGGRFVIEVFVPDLSRFDGGQDVRALHVSTESLAFQASLLDPVAQRVRSQSVVVDDGGVQLQPVQLRYAWPSELDLMARLAGLRLRDRWAGWDRSRFTATSTGHVSVYEQA